MDPRCTPLLDDWTSPDGSRLRIRAVRPHDAAALQSLIGNLSPLDRRRRFHGALNNLSGQRLADMANVDGHRHIALVVLAERAGHETLIADVRCVIDPSDIAAEFALVVARAWRGRGVGQRALAALRRTAAGEGLHWLYGHVLADNVEMLALMRRCGFTLTPHRRDDLIVVAESRCEPSAEPAEPTPWWPLWPLRIAFNFHAH
jgi:RimJ/RimL family protein N-acetyltransferase